MEAGRYVPDWSQRLLRLTVERRTTRPVTEVPGEEFEETLPLDGEESR